MRIDKAYKGVTESSVVLWDSGMCDGPELRLGEQYLMYTHEDGSGYLPSRGCTRSRNVKYAAEDLKFLDGLASAPPTVTIFGQVVVGDGGIGPGKPAARIPVEVSRGGETRTTITDAEGHYKLAGLTPGTYSARGIQAGFGTSESETDVPVEVEARTCAELDVVLRKIEHGSIRGLVRQADGAPAPAGIKVDLIRVDADGPNSKPELMIGFGAHTDEAGEYSFQGVAPGHYKVVLNLYHAPTAAIPYKTLFWPEASTEVAASVVGISTDEMSQQCDFRLPPPLKSTPVKFVVLLPDGTPAKEVRANIGTWVDGMSSSAGEAHTDINGQFSFEAMEGFDYTVGDIFTAAARTGSRMHFSAADGSKTIIVRLVPEKR